jgi:electron transfer flavoprotein beta subunit
VKIVVCVKQVPATTAEKRYTSELRLDRAATEAVINPLDEYAIEQALRLKEGGVVDEVVYLSMGPDSASEALRRSLAMGGDGGVLVTDPALAGADEWGTARVLAAALDRLAPEVTLMGMASDDARAAPWCRAPWLRSVACRSSRTGRSCGSRARSRASAV